MKYLLSYREKPLSMYVFTEDQTLLHRVLRSTSAGGVVHNDTLQHYSCKPTSHFIKKIELPRALKNSLGTICP